jgi:hypothetical protein
MAIIHTTPRQSGTEGLIRLLDNLTDEIVLKHGKILMGQFSHGRCNSLKLSLFINDDILNEYIGVRNVFIEDVHDHVAVRFADKLQTQMSLETLRQSRDWDKAFPADNRNTYPLTELDKGAVDVRDYLLFGRLPSQPVSEALLNLINTTVPDTGFIEFDIVASLIDYDIF